jgi:phosphatidyl-myo-inositol dimannoside synthase
VDVCNSAGEFRMICASLDLSNRGPSITSTPRLSLNPGALLTTDFPPVVGGISTLLWNIYSRFELQSIRVVAPRHAGAEAFDSAYRYEAKRFSQSSSMRGFAGVSQLYEFWRCGRRLILENPALLLHCGHVNAAIAARRLKHRYGTKYLVWSYGLEVMDKWLQPLILPALREADLVIAISEFTRHFLLAAGVQRSRIVKIRPGTDPDRFCPDVPAREIAQRFGIAGRPTLLTVSRVVKANRYKGHDIVIQALPAVVRAIPNIIYLIVGQGDDLGYLDRLAHECGIREHVRFAGGISDKELPLLYNCCDTFIMCSREERSLRGPLVEGFGLALLEASACAKPVVAGRSGGIPDAVLDGITGLLVNPADPESVSRAVIDVFRNPGMARTLGNNGRRWVIDEMNWDRAAQEFHQALGKLRSEKQ